LAQAIFYITPWWREKQVRFCGGRIFTSTRALPPARESHGSLTDQNTGKLFIKESGAKLKRFIANNTY